MADGQQQVGFLRRFLIKNFSARPEEMEAFLRQQGVELDPAGFDLEDVTDIFFDTIAGLLITSGALGGAAIGAGAGAPTGPGAAATTATGAALGGSIAAQGAEAIRQTVGDVVTRLTGVQLTPTGETVAPEAFRREAAIGAATPALGQLGEKATRGAIRIGGQTGRFALRQVRSLGQRLSGAPKEAFEVAVRTPALTQGTAQTAAQLSDDLAQFVTQPMDKIAELTQAKTLLAGARAVPLRPLLLLLSNLQKEFAVTGGRRSARTEAARLIENILEEFGLEQKFQKALGTRIPAEIAERIKQQFQREANFSGRVFDDPVNEVFQKAARTMRFQIESALKTPQLRAQYRKLMQKASAKIDALKELRQRLGVTERAVGGAAQLDIGRTESFVGNLLGKAKTRENRLLQRLDARFGTDFAKRGEQAAAIQGFGGPEQLTSVVPGRITATGAFLGSALGAGTGAALGGTIGAAGLGGTAGALAGMVAASPRATVMGARAVDTISRGISAAERGALRIPARLGPAAQASIATGLRTREVPEQPQPVAVPQQVQPTRSDVEARIDQLLNEINSMPNLTGQQRLDLFQQRIDQESASEQPVSAGAP